MGNSEGNIQPTVDIFGCTDCGADLKFKPGTTALTCEYCGAKNEIPVSDTKIQELDFHEYFEKGAKELDTIELNLVKCNTCGAESSLEPHIASSSCPYCATPLIVSNAHSESIIQPKSLLPFKLTKKEALEAFKIWINKLWFAPNSLKKAILSFDHFKGVYLPFWTFDSNTTTNYTGQKGVHYYVSETYSTTENGKYVTKTRQVQKTRWSYASGQIIHAFDDVLIPASESLPKKQVKELEPWDLPNLVPFNKKYLSGFITEKYQVNLETGFNRARVDMEDSITGLIRRDIGGDVQRIHTRNTQFEAVTFKHILLPAYVSAYKFKDKLYRFMVNARTGEVQGERPWSTVKIALAVVGVIAVALAAYFLFGS